MTATQLVLPGQEAAVPGPCDLNGMYVMHHGFRRDLARFAVAARHTPTDDVATWRLLHARWQRFAHLLHDHHAKEDEAIWPLLLERVDAAGDTASREVLEAMEAEHEDIDPLLEAIGTELTNLAAGTRPSAGPVATLLDRAREVLGHHLGHEERAAIPVIQTYVDGAGWARLEHTRLAEKPKRPGDLMFLLAWLADGLEERDLAPFLDTAGPVVRLLLRLSRGRYRRADARAFVHCPSHQE